MRWSNMDWMFAPIMALKDSNVMALAIVARNIHRLGSIIRQLRQDKENQNGDLTKKLLEVNKRAIVRLRIENSCAY